MTQKDILKDKVLNFLKIGKEGPSWDFKQEWHKNSGDLLKDIICFSNTTNEDDCYLIFGVTDKLEVVGMQETRRKQADIINLIEEHKFAGGIRPNIEVDTIIINNKEIDVLTIYNSDNTPFYLTKSFGPVFANCIYLRKGDRNTPDKSNAEFTDIENLWKKRFHLLNSKLDFIVNALNPVDWEYSDGKYFYTKEPQYSIEFVDNGIFTNPDFYSFNMINSSTYFGTLYIRYQNTTLRNYQTAVLDGGRLEIITPQIYHFYRNEFGLSPKYSYSYYVENDYSFKVLNFLLDITNSTESIFAFKKLKEVILFFKTIEEKKKFDKYLEANISLFEKELESLSNEYYEIDCKNIEFVEIYKIELNTGKALNKMLNEWRKSNTFI